MLINSLCRSGVCKKSTLALTAFACLLPLLAARAERSTYPLLENCKVPPGAEPWRDANQTSECRTIELIHAMTLDDKITHLGVSFGKQKGDRFGIPSLNPADGPNGFARGPMPGPPPPSAAGATQFPTDVAV